MWALTSCLGKTFICLKDLFYYYTNILWKKIVTKDIIELNGSYEDRTYTNLEIILNI